jgi:hypothetical protein
MGIETTQEWKQSIRMRPACNNVLCNVFDVKECDIKRYEQLSGPHILDSEFAIDLKVILENGSQLSGQEKALSHHYHFYKTFTIEFYQDRNTKERGEFFKIASQFYLSGYSDATEVEFIEWHILKMFDLINWIKTKDFMFLERQLKPSAGSRACFLPIPYNKIPEHIFYASGDADKKIKIFDTVDGLFKGIPK